MKTTGQILRENREKKGITLNEVALATKINVKMLTAIEEGQTDRLPTKTFLRGFVRSYARYLGLDEEAILTSFYEEMGSTKPKVNVTAEAPLPQTPSEEKTTAAKALDPNAGSTGAKIGAVVGILALVVLIVVIKKKMESYEKEAVISERPNVEAVNTDGTPVDPLAGAASPTPNPLIAAAVVAPTASPSPSPTASPAATPTASPTPSPTATPSPTPKPTATPTPSPTPTTTPEPTATPSPTPSPTPKPSASPSATPSPAPGKVQEVMIEALDTVEIEAKIDGEPAKKMKLSADQIQTFKAKRKVMLNISNGGAVNLIVNGNDRGVPGDLGKPAKVQLP